MRIADARMIRHDLVFAESLRWHGGALWFSDMHAGHVISVDTDGRTLQALDFPGRPSGLGWMPDGQLLAVSMLDHRVLRREGARWVVHAELGGVNVLQSNDMIVDRLGRATVGSFGFDPFLPVPWVAVPLALVAPDGTVQPVADDLLFPNGMVLTPDEDTLIVAESAGRRLTSYTRDADGRLSRPETFAELDGYPDGIALDADGAVWATLAVAGTLEHPRPGAVVRVARGGAVLDRIDLEQGRVGVTCVLGGPNGRTLFISDAATANPEAITGAGNGWIRAIDVEAPGVSP